MIVYDTPANLDLPFPIIPRLYDRALIVPVGRGRLCVFAWRWLPVVRWRYLSRAWQGEVPAGYVLSTDWTGRTRELIGWEWPVAVKVWSEIDLTLWHLETALDWKEVA